VTLILPKAPGLILLCTPCLSARRPAAPGCRVLQIKNKLLTIMLIGPRINAHFIARSSGLFEPAEEKNIYSITQYLQHI
jgi:hypothetical protein